MAGPLEGLKLIEMAGIGPCPLAGQLMADLGAEVIVIDRKSGGDRPGDVNNRNKKSVALNLKTPEGVEAALALIASADALIEGFRPGVMERMGLGPDVCLEKNPGLVFGRMTGWGQEGPWSQMAGHDLNYVSLTGALGMMGKKGQEPTPPLNLVADYGGGTMFLVFGVLSALWERSRSGKGQVVDTAMIDGVAAMTGIFRNLMAAGRWDAERESNMLDGGAPFYRCYETSDGKHVSIGSIEGKFYAELKEKLGMAPDAMPEQMNPAKWDEYRAEIAAVIATKTRDEWCDVMEGSDVCFAPVLDMDEAPAHPHNVARETFIEVEGVTQPNAAPRFSGTPAGKPTVAPDPGHDTDEALSDWGFDADEVARLRASGAVS